MILSGASCSKESTSEAELKTVAAKLMAVWHNTCFEPVISPKCSPVSLRRYLFGEVGKKSYICFNLLHALVPSLTYVAFLSKSSQINTPFRHRFEHVGSTQRQCLLKK